MIKNPQLSQMLLGALIGGAFGTCIGLAGFGGVTEGLLTLGILGAYLGWHYSQLTTVTKKREANITSAVLFQKAQISEDKISRVDEPRFKHALLGASLGYLFGFCVGKAGFGDPISGLFSLGTLGAYLGWNFYQFTNITFTRQSKVTEEVTVDDKKIVPVEPPKVNDTELYPIDETAVIKQLKARVIRTLSLQLHLMGKEPPYTPSDDFSLGYVFGVIDGCSQYEGFASDSAETTGVAIMVFFEIYGADLWQSFLGKVLDNHADSSSQIFNGASVGARDYLTFVESVYSGDFGPMGWVTHSKALS